ncbi:carboxylic acid reductase [Nocardia sp. NPDC057272]|uniref:carboxylic acid reductase n=1 Tax=Nocardia sp. NPDC057272 TaxID=3346079 RepID=UPI0036317CB9
MGSAGIPLERRIEILCERDAQARAALRDPELSAKVRQPALPLAHLAETVMTGYGDRPAVGRRVTELAVDRETGCRTTRLLPRFGTVTYRELWDRVGAVAASWWGGDFGLRPGDFVAIVGVTGGDYATLDLACVHLGAVAVPLQANASGGELAAVLAETVPRVLAVGVEFLDRVVGSVPAQRVPRALIVFDVNPGDDEHARILADARRRLPTVAVRTLDEIVSAGRAEPPAPLFGGDAESMSLLIYTSGSTGTPKGAIYTQRLVARMWLNASPVPALTLAYMPMSHVAARLSLYGTLGRGGTTYCTGRPDRSTLLDDLALVRPTEIAFAPRVCELLLHRFRDDVDRRRAAGADPELARETALDTLRREVLGGRAVYAIFGSAPMAAEAKLFAQALLGFDLHDGYGATEALDILLDHRIQRPPVSGYKLLDVPELGYFTTDRPHPRGELLVRTSTAIPGYYRQPELSAAIFDAEGYYRTGDVMTEIAPDHLVYLDRRNNVLKLSNGEFVTVARLEAVYGTSPLIRQIFVYGSSERAYLLAVIVPTDEALAAGSLDSALAAALREVASATGLAAHEIPRDFLVETQPFTADNGLLSGLGKLLRPKVRERYEARLERIYRDHADDRAAELRELRARAAQLPLLEVVVRAAKAVVGSAEKDLPVGASFTDLGGDSLAVVTYSSLLSELLDVELPAGLLTGPGTDFAAIAEYVRRQRQPEFARPSFAAVHGDGTVQVRAEDVTLEAFLDPATVARACALPSVADVAHTVLLTGATGYIGRFLCLEWLRRLADIGGTLICLVRGADPAAARCRLDDAFDSDADLRAEFRALASRHLEIVVGDIAQPALGVRRSAWEQLAARVDHVVHAAAHVNHVLPYRHLFDANVVGTAEIIRLALTTRVKSVDFLSTIAVADSSALDEDADIRVAAPGRRIDDSYANGYEAGKWAGEILLRTAHDRCGLPVTVFRSNMALAHRQYAGQLNVADTFTRLLVSLGATGVAPRSFVRGGPAHDHYDGLPVDFTAVAITALGGDPRPDHRIFHVANPHDDGVSLDRLVDWLIEAGLPVRRIDSYPEWFARFEAALTRLPEPQRRRSVLPLLQAYRQPAEPRSVLPTKRFQDALRAVDLAVPHLDRALIGKYLADFRTLNLLGESDSVRATS